MSRTTSGSIRTLLSRALALLQITLLLSAGCTGGPLNPSPGAAEYQQPGLVHVPGGVVNAGGGNLMIERTDITLDTVVAGTFALGAVYNSSTPGWTWSFGITYDGSELLDPSGRRVDVTAIANGAAIPGTYWVKLDADTVQTKGGLAHHFDARGRLAVVRWATLDYPRLTYTWGVTSLDIAQCITAAACPVFYSIALDPQQRPLSMTDVRGGRHAELTWNASGQLVVAKSPLEVAQDLPGTRYEYGGAGRLTAITNSEGERIEYIYQSAGRLLDATQIGEGNPTHRFEFYSQGSNGLYETLYTNPLGARTRFYFDPEGRLNEREFVETGERTTLAWAGLRPASITLASGATTAYTYQADDPVRIADAAGNVITITYEPGALSRDNPWTRAVRRLEDSLGPSEEHAYDAQGRLETIANGEGESSTLTYNGGSSVESVVQPFGGVLEFPLYGVHGHWLEMDGVASDKRSFDPVGNPRVETAKGRRGGVLTQQFDENRWLASLGVAATDVNGVTATGTITLERRSDGQLLAIQRPYGGNHELVYDGLGRLSLVRERVDGQWRVTLFERDLVGRVTARTFANGMREEWQYDGYGRVTRHRALRSGALEGEALFSYQDGQLASMVDSMRGTTELYSYDTAGRLVLTTFGYGETQSLEYDLRSRVTAEVLAVPGQVLFDLGYEYDLADRLVRTTDRAAQQVLVEHVIVDAQVLQIAYGNGLVRNFTYDEAGLVTGMQTLNGSGATVETTTIERTGETNPQRLQVRTATTTPLASTDEEYWLDAGESISDPGKRVFGYRVGSSEPRYYAYDELSNQVAAGQIYTSEHNRLIAQESLTFTYDAAGFATSRGGIPITWTATGRLASYGPATADWDLSGRPIEIAFDGLTRRFDLFGGRLESDASTGAIGALDLGAVSRAPLSGDRSYRHFDFRGNVSFVTSAAGAVTEHYRYGPYGGVNSYGSGANANTFVGKPRAGPFLLLGARVYDPTIGRFISPDPILTMTNQFAYTSGNPISFADSSGSLEITASQRAAAAAVLNGAAGLFAGIAVGLQGVAAGARAYPAIVAGARTGSFLAGGMALAFKAAAEYVKGGGSPGTADPSGAAIGVSANVPAISLFGTAGQGPRGDKPYGPGEGWGDAASLTQFSWGGGGGSPACAPSSLTHLPQFGRLIWCLIGLQLLLAGMLLARRRVRGSER